MLASVLFNVQSLQAGAFTHLASFPLCSRRLTMTSQGMRAAQESEATLARELEADTAVSARAERLAATPAEFVLSCTIPALAPIQPWSVLLLLPARAAAPNSVVTDFVQWAMLLRCWCAFVLLRLS